MTTCWFSWSNPPRSTARWLSALLVVLIALAGCQHATEDGSDAETATAPLFQEFERYYDPPDMSSYDIGEGVRVLNPQQDERLPLVFEEDVRMLSQEVQDRAYISQSVIRIPRGEFEGAEDLAVGDILITGFDNDAVWSRVTAVEHLEEAVVLHTVQAELDDVIFLAEFILEVEGESPFPEGFNLLDVYMNPEPRDSDIRSLRQGLSAGESCVEDVAQKIIDNQTDGIYGPARSIFNAEGFSAHRSWLIDRRNHYASQDEDFDPEPFNDAINEATCVPTRSFDGAQARSNWESSPNLSNPPVYQCMSYWMIDYLAEQVNSASAEGDLNYQEVCDALNADQDDDEGADEEQDAVNEDGRSLGGLMSDGLEAGFQLPIPGAGSDGFSADLDQVLIDQCHNSCENNAPDAEVDSCKSSCPTFNKCFGMFCFELTDLSVSYKPKFVLRFKIGWTGARLRIGVEGPLTFKIGAQLSAEYSFNWERSKQFSFPIPKLGFSVGPISVGFHIYAEFGVSFSFDAKAVIHAVYTLVFDTEIGIQIRVPGSSGPYGGFSRNEDESGLDIDASGEVSASFNAWAGGGIGFFLGFSNNSSLPIPELIEDKINLPSGKLLWIEPIKALFNVSATIASPKCPLSASARVGGEFGWDVDFGIFSLSGTKTIWDYVFFEREWELHEFIPPLRYICDLDSINFEEPVFEGDRDICNTGDPDSCEAGFGCHQGTCVEENDLRFILEWAPHVKLSLMIIDPNGQRYSLFIGDDSVFTRWDDPVENPTDLGYFEVAGFDAPTPGLYRFYVVQNPNYATSDPSTEIGFTINVDHNDRRETVSGSVDLTVDEMPVMFEYCVAGGEGC